MKKWLDAIINNPKKTCEIVLILAIVFLTVGFSAYSSELGINGILAEVRIQKDIRISGVNLASTNGGATSNAEDYNVNSIMSTMVLPNADSSVTYNVRVTNIGNVEASLSEISGLPSNLTYTINNYELRDMLCDDVVSTKCNLGSVTTLNITIKYAENGYNSSNINYPIKMDFKFTYMVDAVAKVGDSFYDTLQEAINSVPTDNTETTVILLKNTSEIITIAENQNIVFDLASNVLSNNGNKPVITNNGTIKISNGTISTSAASNGAINNEATGNITMTGGHVIVTGGRQALYNNQGVALITGNAYLNSKSTTRATVQNVKNGTLTITGGTIISTGYYGVSNAGTMTIGVKDSDINNEYPMIQAVNNGVYSKSNFKFYDGIVKSKIDPFNDLAKITDKEPNYGIVNATEDISGNTYNTAHLGISEMVTFNANGGTVSETIRYVESGHQVGTLPTGIKSGYSLDGWYTAATGGEQIHANTVITDDITFYAHWIKNKNVAQIDSVIYDTLQDAINAVPNDGTKKKITLLKDTSEKLTVASGKNIELDLNGMEVSNSGYAPVIENSGTLELYGGSFKSTADQSIINNLDGHLVISGGNFTITSTRQVVYITGGLVEIKGDAYLSSQARDKPTGSNMERGTVHNVSGTLIITGGTIVGNKQQAVSNEASLTIGTKNGSINTSSPVLIGAVNGLKSTGTFNFYDGIIKGKTDSINATITDKENNSEVVNGTEVISGATYKTAHLKFNE